MKYNHKKTPRVKDSGRRVPWYHLNSRKSSAGAHASVTGGPVRAYWLPFGRMLKGDIRVTPAAAFHRPAALCAHE